MCLLYLTPRQRNGMQNLLVARLALKTQDYLSKHKTDTRLTSEISLNKKEDPDQPLIIQDR